MFGELVRKKRKEKFLTQQELSERLHIDQTHISKIESEVATPSVELLVEIIKALDISGLELLNALRIPVSAKNEGTSAKLSSTQRLEKILDSITVIEQKQRDMGQSLQSNLEKLAELREAVVLLKGNVDHEMKK